MTLPNYENITLLIADDNEISTEFLSELLTPSRINIVIARDGKQAVKLALENNSINIILMDIGMPIMNGLEAMLEIKKEKPNMPIIAQTTSAKSGDKEKYLNSGFDDYISKPILLEVLIQKISSLIAKK